MSSISIPGAASFVSTSDRYSIGGPLMLLRLSDDGIRIEARWHLGRVLIRPTRWPNRWPEGSVTVNGVWTALWDELRWYEVIYMLGGSVRLVKSGHDMCEFSTFHAGALDVVFQALDEHGIPSRTRSTPMGWLSPGDGDDV